MSYILFRSSSINADENIVCNGDYEECASSFNREVTKLVMKGFKPMEASEDGFEKHVMLSGTFAIDQKVEVTLSIRRRLRGEVIED